MTGERDGGSGLEVACVRMRLRTSSWITTSLATTAWLGGLPGFAGLVVACSSRSAPAAAALLALPSAVALVLLLALRAREMLGEGRALVDRGTVTLASSKRRVSFAVSEIASGARSPVNREVHLELRDGRCAMLGPLDDRDAARLLRASGTAVEQRALSVRLRGTAGPLMAGALYFGLGLLLSSLVARALSELGVTWGSALLLLPIFAASAVFAAAMVRVRRPRVVIGIDGLRIKRGFTSRFVAYDDIVDVAVSSVGEPHILVTTRARTYALPIVGMEPADVSRVRTRIWDAMRARRRAGRSAADAFARRGRVTAKWREDLLSLVGAERNYRAAHVTAEDAEAVLDDPSAPVDARIGAAIALRATGREDVGERLRLAVDASADEGARRALAAALESEDEALDEALEALPAAPSRVTGGQ
ncbi:MAG: hypothetical protein U0414_24800 [Polyangiaceae bacterium]